MSSVANYWLIAAAALSAIASLLHVGIIFGGAPWYRFFGAGERFARAAEAGQIWQHFVTLAIAVVLALWAAYALSGAHVLPRLPLLRTALVLITAVYLVRGSIVFLVLFAIRGEASPFLIWSSLICLAFGIVHVIGMVEAWPSL